MKFCSSRGYGTKENKTKQNKQKATTKKAKGKKKGEQQKNLFHIYQKVEKLDLEQSHITMTNIHFF